MFSEDFLQAEVVPEFMGDPGSSNLFKLRGLVNSLGPSDTIPSIESSLCQLAAVDFGKVTLPFVFMALVSKIGKEVRFHGVGTENKKASHQGSE